MASAYFTLSRETRAGSILKSFTDSRNFREGRSASNIRIDRRRISIEPITCGDGSHGLVASESEDVLFFYNHVCQYAARNIRIYSRGSIPICNHISIFHEAS